MSGSAVVALAALVLACPGAGTGTDAGSSAPASGLRVVVFLDTGCPIARHHTRTLRLLHERFSGSGVAFEGWFPRARVTAGEVTAFGREFDLPFPLRVDVDQARAREMGATTVPEVFLHDSAGNLLYRGRIDDHYAAIGKRRQAPRSNDLADALAAAVAGRDPAVARTEPVGCPITFRTRAPGRSGDPVRSSAAR